jgi:hypothetical protein
METMVDLRDFWNWTFVMHLARLFLIYNISRSLFKEKYKPIVTLLVYFAVLFPFSWLSVEISARVETSMVQFLEAGSIIFFIAATFLLLVFLTEGKKIIKLFVSILSVFSYSILAIFFNIFASVIDSEALLSGIAYEVSFTHFIGQIAFCFFSSFLVVLLFKLIKAKTNNHFQYQSKYCWFFLFPISHWITVVFLYYIARLTYATPLGTKIANISTIIYFVFSVTDFALLFFIDHFENLEIKNVQNEITKTKNELDYFQIELLKEETLVYVEGDQESRPVEEADRFSEELKEKADAENIELKDISVIEERGNRALIAIKLYNSELGKNFTLTVKMNKLVDGTWRIKEITNLVDYFLEVDKAQKEKLIEAR